MKKKTLGEYHLEVADSMLFRGYINGTQGNYQQALEMYLVAEEILAQSSLRDNVLPLRANLKSSEGWIHFRLGDLKKGEQLYKLALKWREELFGSDHIDIANSYHELCELSIESDKMQLALYYVNREYDLLKTNFSNSSHPAFAKCHLLMGQCHFKSGNIDSASSHFLQGRDLLKKLSQNHFRIGQFEWHLGNLYLSQNLLANAEYHYELSLKIRRLNWKVHKEISDSLSSLAQVVTKQNFFFFCLFAEFSSKVSPNQ